MSERVMLPRNWSHAALGELVYLAGRIGWRGLKAEEYIPSGPVLLSVFNLNYGIEVDFRNVNHISGARYEESPEIMVQRDDILLVKDGAGIGKLGIVGELPGKTTINSSLLLIRVSEILDPKYLFFFLAGPELQLLAQKRISGSTTPHLFQKDIKYFSVSIAPLNEQRRIVAKIEALTARSRRAKEALDAIPPLLERFRQSVLASAFRGDLTADWRAKHLDVEPASVLLERIRVERRRRWEEAELAKMRAKGKEPKDDKWKSKYQEPAPVDTEGLPELPEGWCWASLEELKGLSANSMTDGPFGSKLKTAHYVTSGVRVIRLGNIGVGVFKDDDKSFITYEHFTSLKKHQIFSGDLVIAALAEPVGRCCMVPKDIERALVKADCVRYVPYVEMESNLIMNWLNSPIGNKCSERLCHGVGRLRVNMENMRALPIPVLPIDEQLVLKGIIDKYFVMIRTFIYALSKVANTINTLNQSILAKAFQGELVPQDPNDEPASVLLERIRAERQTVEAKKTNRSSRRQRSPRKAKQEKKSSQPEPEPEPQILKTPVHVSASVPPATIKTIQQPEFLDFDPEEQLQVIHEVLLGRGPLSKEQAIHQAADRLKETGMVRFQRLRSDGPLYQKIQKTIEAGLKLALMDRPQRGQVRAILSEAGAYTPDHWRRCLLQVLDEVPVDRDNVIHVAALWAQYHMGLQFKRLRRGGIIDKGLRSAINRGIRRGEVERVGANKIKAAR